MSSITLGIDLASQPKTTAICALDWEAHAPSVRMLAVGQHDGTELHDKFLSTTIAGMREFPEGSIAKAAIDAPFGWPEEFVKAVTDHHWSESWPSAIDESRARFYRRETDRWIQLNAHKTPLSVSTDKIAFVAMRCAVLLNDLKHKCGPESVSRLGTGLVCEVYPDPALRRWTDGRPRALTSRETYKGGPASDRRRNLLQILNNALHFNDPSGLLEKCIDQDHALDALVAALVARATYLGQTVSAPTTERVSREGWIHLPTEPLEMLTAESGH